MTDDEDIDLYAYDLQMSKDMGVPRHLYENSPDHIDWFGRFTVQINGNKLDMVLTPSSLFINHSDIHAPVALLVGSEWIESPAGSIFRASFSTHQVAGDFNIFREADSSPIEGFESFEHTHMLVYTDGAAQKQYHPIVVTFASEL
jgi:hypothetical protein